MHRATRALIPLVTLLVACGDSSAEETTPPPPVDTAGDERPGSQDAEDSDASLMADPCAEDGGSPCSDEQGVDAGAGELTDDGEDSPEGEEGGAEGEPAARGEGEPQMSWRNMVGAGRVVFERVCGVCHPEGQEDIGPDIRNRRVPVERLTYIIRNGTGDMRPIPQRKLPDRYVDELMAFLTTLGTVTGVERPE